MRINWAARAALFADKSNFSFLFCGYALLECDADFHLENDAFAFNKVWDLWLFGIISWSAVVSVCSMNRFYCGFINCIHDDAIYT